MIECGDFERLWNQRLDERGGAARELEAVLEAHAAGCARCRSLGARYHTLDQAIRALGPPPVVPAGLVDRVLSQPRLPNRWTLRRLARLAAAAAILVAVVLGSRSWKADEGAGVSPSTAEVRSIDPRDVSEALAEASSATLVLAREASTPAARLGGQVFQTDAGGETPTITLRVPDPAGLISGGALWLRVGERVESGFRPLSGTARHAFGFLLDSTEIKEKDSAPRTPRGA